MKKDMEKFDHSKTHANVGKVGNVEHGRTPLTAAIAEVLRINFEKETKNSESK